MEMIVQCHFQLEHHGAVITELHTHGNTATKVIIPAVFPSCPSSRRSLDGILDSFQGASIVQTRQTK